MGMGQQHEVDGRHLVDAESGVSLSPQQNQALGEDRIDQHEAAADLQQKRRVPDKGYAQLVRSNDLGPSRLASYRLCVALPAPIARAALA